MSKEESKRLQIVYSDKIKTLFKQIKKYSDAGSTATSYDEMNASMLCCYKLLNEVKNLKDKYESV